MATSDSREVVIEASPEEIIDVIADVEQAAVLGEQVAAKLRAGGAH